jgi:hypothetical protein
VGPLVSALVRLDLDLSKAEKAKKHDKNQEEVNNLTQRLATTRQILDPVTEPLGRMDQQLADLLASWDKADEATGLTILARWLRAESIQALDDSIFLHAQVVSSGGHNRTSRSLLRMIFFGDGECFMGGATVRWAQLEKDGAVTNGGILSARAWGRFPSSLLSLKKESYGKRETE